jgi:hypothetical protein
MTTPNENAVRLYLTALTNPESLIDKTLIADLEKRLAKSTDVIERLRLTSDLRKSQSPDVDELETAFVAHAAAYASEAGLTRADFAAIGVPASVLRRAFEGEVPAGRKVASRRVGFDEVKSAIVTIKKGTTFTMLSVNVPGHPTTIKRAVNELIEEGKVERIGPDPDHSGRGVRPILYRRA